MVKLGYIKQNVVQHIRENLMGYIIALVSFLIGISSGCFYYKYVGDYFGDSFGRYMESYLEYIANGSADRWVIFHLVSQLCRNGVFYNAFGPVYLYLSVYLSYFRRTRICSGLFGIHAFEPAGIGWFFYIAFGAVAAVSAFAAYIFFLYCARFYSIEKAEIIKR